MSCTAAPAQRRATTSQMTDVACGASLDHKPTDPYPANAWHEIIEPD